MEHTPDKKFPLNAKDYKLFEEVGEGVSATVHRALCIPLNERVAIKVLDLEKCNNDLVCALLSPWSVEIFFLYILIPSGFGTFSVVIILYLSRDITGWYTLQHDFSLLHLFLETHFACIDIMLISAFFFLDRMCNEFLLVYFCC